MASINNNIDGVGAFQRPGLNLNNESLSKIQMSKNNCEKLDSSFDNNFEEIVMVNFSNVKIESPRVKRIAKREGDFVALDLETPREKEQFIEQSLNLSFDSFLSIVEEKGKRANSFQNKKVNRLNTYKSTAKLRKHEEEKLSERISELKENSGNRMPKKYQTINNLFTVNEKLKIRNVEKLRNLKGSVAASDFFKIEEDYETNDRTEIFKSGGVTGSFTDTLKLLKTSEIDNKLQENVIEPNHTRAVSDISQYRIGGNLNNNFNNQANMNWNETDYDYKCDERPKVNIKLSNIFQENDVFKINTRNRKWVDQNKDRQDRLTSFAYNIENTYDLDATRKMDYSSEMENVLYFTKLNKLRNHFSLNDVTKENNTIFEEEELTLGQYCDCLLTFFMKSVGYETNNEKREGGNKKSSSYVYKK